MRMPGWWTLAFPQPEAIMSAEMGMKNEQPRAHQIFNILSLGGVRERTP